MIGLEEGWHSLKQEGIDVVLDMLTQGLGNAKPMKKEDFVRIYTYAAAAPGTGCATPLIRPLAPPRPRKCHDMCVQKAPHNWSPALYDRHGEVRPCHRTIAPPPHAMKRPFSGGVGPARR